MKKPYAVETRSERTLWTARLWGDLSGPPSENGRRNGFDGHPERREGFPIPSARLGLWIFLGTVTMLFAGFTRAYLVRQAGPGWAAAPAPADLVGQHGGAPVEQRPAGDRPEAKRLRASMGERSDGARRALLARAASGLAGAPSARDLSADESAQLLLLHPDRCARRACPRRCDRLALFARAHVARGFRGAGLPPLGVVRHLLAFRRRTLALSSAGALPLLRRARQREREGGRGWTGGRRGGAG